MKAWAQNKYTASGFTIVELLIVVVVIAILATVTIVAFNGITDRSRDSAVKSSASQVAKKLAVYSADNLDSYPTQANFASVTGANDTASTTYTYLVTADNKGYCASAADSAKPSVSYAVTPNSALAAQQACTTNMVANPTLEAGTGGWVWNTGGLTAGATGTGSNPTSGGYVDPRTARFTLATPGSVTSLGPYTSVTGLNATTTYQLSAWVRSSKPLSYLIRAELRNSSSTLLSAATSSVVTLVPDTWTRVSMTVPPTANLDRLTFCIYSSGTVAVVAGDYTEIDGALLTAGPTPVSLGADGMRHWYWVGAQNASSSFGPALTF